MKRQSLIIGGSGFVGQWLRPALLEHGFGVRCFDTRPSGADDELIGDVFDAAALRRACAGVNVVCHLVALQSSRKHPWEAFHRLNVETTARILEECLRAGVEHLVYFSTELVYGRQDDGLVREDVPLRPRGFYGKSKMLAEDLCRSYETRGLRVTILRPPNIMGPGKTRVVEELFERINRGAPIPLIGGGRKPWQTIDVRDVAKIAARIVTEGLSGTYNLGAPYPLTASEVYSRLVAHAGSRSRLVPVPAELFRMGCAGLDLVGLSPLTADQYHRLADSWILDSSRLSGKISYTPKYAEVQSVLETYDAYMKDRTAPHADRSREKPAPGGQRRRAADLKGQVVIVTGASRGIGRATAQAFARRGARLVVTARDAAALEHVQHEIEAAGGEALAVVTDVRDEAQVHKLVQAALDRWGRIDVLVNNAGLTAVAPLAQMSTQQIREILDVNLTGSIHCIREVLPHFIGQRGGHIVNVASILGKRGVPKQAVYAASKAGVLRLAEALRSELAPHGITVTSFCPSSTRTAMNEQASAGDHPLKQLIRRAFMATPEAVAERLVKATMRRRREVVLSLPAKMIAALNACCPGVLDWVFARLERRR